MSKKVLKICFAIVIFSAIVFVFSNAYASVIDTPSFKQSGQMITNAGVISRVAKTAIYATRAIGIAVAVGYVMYLGIKYMTSATNEKADVKKRLIPFFIGIFIFFGFQMIFEWILSISQEI